MLLASGVNFGIRKTVPHMFGILTGFASMTAGVALGVGKIFELVPSLFYVLKVLAFGYLLYLAWKIANSGPAKTGDASGKPLTFGGALALQYVNPKAWIATIGFFAAYLPVELQPIDIVVGSLVFYFVSAPSVLVWTALGTVLVKVLSTPKSRVIFNWSMATLLVASMIPVLLH